MVRVMVFVRNLIIQVLLLVMFFIQTATARHTDWFSQPYSQVRLIASADEPHSSNNILLAIEMRLRDGWKTYWHSPGAAGLPLSIDWKNSENVAFMNVVWPTPERHQLLGFDTFGYQQHIVFPIDWAPINPKIPVIIRLKAEYMICKDVCIPYQEDIEFSLPTSESILVQENAFDIEVFGLIDRFRNQVPIPVTDSSIEVLDIAVSRGLNQDTLNLVLMLKDTNIAAYDAVVVVNGTVISDRPQLSQLGQGRLHISIPIIDAITTKPTFLDNQSKITLTLLPAGQRGLEIIREVKDIAVINDQVINNSENSASIWYFILAALLGGLILNVMPCVLPVLSLKLINLFQHKETSYRNIRLSFLATAAGILFSFASLAGFLGILQKSGQAIGWGIQFQEPIFIALLAFIIVFFAAIMWGWVQLSGPSFNVTVPRDQKARTPSFAQSFSTGFLATLMATPCSAPFVSTAVGFALSQEPLILLLILLFMGVGLAMPYMLVAAFPVIAHWLPKPGRWMVTVKNLMGLLLLFTVGWLVWILFAMIDGRWVVSIIMLLAATLIMLGIKKRYYNGNFKLTLAIWLVVMPALIWTAWNAPEKNTQLLSDNTGWVAFNEHDIPGLVAQGKTVFVDVTAAWCLTCIANKKFVLENPSIIEALQQKHVIAMRADWTKPNDQILEYLKKLGRFGIPMNVVYSRRLPTGHVFPILLDIDDVRQYLLSN